MKKISKVVSGTLTEFGNIAGGPAGAIDYTDLTNKPQINGVTLNGNLNSETDLGIIPALISTSYIDSLFS